MAARSKIEWTDATWNPVTGCTKISPGCRHCFAERIATRLKHMKHPRYAEGFQPVQHEDLLTEPLRWRKPRMILTCSMSDLFHDAFSDEFLRQIFAVMNQASQHIFQVLTKRPERARRLGESITWSSNVWLGVSVENEAYLPRIDALRTCRARVKFLSLEPLLAPLPSLNLQRIDWVIVGGERARRPRPMLSAWARSIRDLCIQEGVPFFFKQHSAELDRRKSVLLDGQAWEQMPEAGPRPLPAPPLRSIPPAPDLFSA